MKNREIISALNNLYALRTRESERSKEDKVFTGKVLFLMSRNLRSLEKEYNENYMKDYQELREKYYITKEEEVMVPPDEENGINEHAESRKIEVLKPGFSDEEYKFELNELLDVDVTINISKISADDLENVYDFRDMDAVYFMVE